MDRTELLQLAKSPAHRRFFYERPSSGDQNSRVVAAGSYQGLYTRVVYDSVPPGFVAVPKIVIFTVWVYADVDKCDVMLCAGSQNGDALAGDGGYFPGFTPANDAMVLTPALATVLDIVDYSAPIKNTVRQLNFAVDPEGLVYDEYEKPFFEVYSPYTSGVNHRDLGVNGKKIHVFGHLYKKP